MKKYPLLIDVFIGHFLPKINALLVMFQSQRFISLRFCVFAQKYCSSKICHVPHARAEELETKKIKRKWRRSTLTPRTKMAPLVSLNLYDMLPIVW